MNSTFERDPKKRKIKPVEGQTSLLDFDLEESSDDSDFRIEDHAEASDDDSIDTVDKDSGSDEEDSEADSVDSYIPPENNLKLSVRDVIKQANMKLQQLDEKALKVLICCGCLGDRSDDTNEIVECDGCGVTVHEGCYGVSDTASISSTTSSCSTEPWFCEACRAGVTNPTCELCPNSGGIFKETDVGKWVHLVCALYVPGVAFGEVDQLTSVTLFEMPYSRWGARTCSLCEEERFSRTGVCIGCDAGMCRTYFHVTCAQREGLLSEAHSEEVDQADPFYAHCKLHSDKTLVRKRKNNWRALQLRTYQRRLQHEQEGHSDTPEQMRIRRKLNKYRQKYLAHKSLKSAPWVPTQKMPRLLTTSASACRKLLLKANLMGIDTGALELQESQIAALVDVRKKWHIPPAFSVEFIGYYLDRNTRLAGMKQGLEGLLETNARLLEEQQELRQKYDQMMKESSEETRVNTSLKQTVHKYHSAILSACPNKTLPAIDDLGRPQAPRMHQPSMGVPTAAALKMGVGFPLNNITSGRHDTGRILSSQVARQDNLLLNNECGICRQCSDQHLLAKCDTCHLYYHLGCLNPPLTRLPKKSKLYGWQCSECDKTSDSEKEIVEVKEPRRSRTRLSKEAVQQTPPKSAPNSEQAEQLNSLIPSFMPKVKIKPIERYPVQSTTNTSPPSPGFYIDTNNTYNAPPPPPVSSNTHYVTTTITTTNNVSDLNPSGDTTTTQTMTMVSQLSSNKSGKKRRRDKHRSRYSPDATDQVREHKRKRKKKCLEIENPDIPHPRITIKIKSIPLPAGEKASLSKPQMFYVPNENNEIPSSVLLPSQSSVSLSPPPPLPTVTPIRPSRASASSVLNVSTAAARKSKDSESISNCDVCGDSGSTQNSVQCDECRKNYHFACLDPPVKKSPKRRGYSWHCADCDPTASDSN